MSLLLPNPNARLGLSKQVLFWSSALVVNLVLISLMYWLTIGKHKVETRKTISLAAVFQPRQADAPEPEIEQIFEVSQAPQNTSMPPPPTVLNLSTLNMDTTVAIPDIKVPIDKSKPDLNLVSLTFSPKGKAEGSVMSSALAQAKPVFQVPPQYPTKAKQNAIEGYVTLKIKVATDGRAEDIQVLDEQPKGVFARSAKRAVIRWRFAAPETTQWQRITIRYELEK